MSAQQILCQVEYRVKLKFVQTSIKCPLRIVNQEKNEYDTMIWVY